MQLKVDLIPSIGEDNKLLSMVIRDVFMNIILSCNKFSNFSMSDYTLKLISHTVISIFTIYKNEIDFTVM